MSESGSDNGYQEEEEVMYRGGEGGHTYGEEMNEELMHKFNGGDDEDEDDSDADSDESDESVNKMISAMVQFLYNEKSEETIVDIVDDMRTEMRDLSKSIKDLTKVLKQQSQSAPAVVSQNALFQEEVKDVKEHKEHKEQRKEKKEKREKREK